MPYRKLSPPPPNSKIFIIFRHTTDLLTTYEHLSNEHLFNEHLFNSHLFNEHLFNEHLFNAHLSKIRFTRCFLVFQENWYLELSMQNIARTKILEIIKNIISYKKKFNFFLFCLPYFIPFYFFVSVCVKSISTLYIYISGTKCRMTKRITDLESWQNCDFKIANVYKI